MSSEEASLPVSLTSEEQSRTHDALATTKDLAMVVTGVSSAIAYGNALWEGITHGVNAETGWSVGIGGVTAWACGALVLHHFDRKSGRS